jgi:hypothetical protein
VQIKQTILVFTLACLAGVHPAAAQGTAFTYQGRLNDGGAPANGSYDLQFIVYNASAGGSEIGPILTNAGTPVSNGLFAVTLNFGANIFTGSNCWLDIAARTNGGGNFTELSPRQPLTPSPYAIFANSASNLLGNLPAGATFSGSVTAGSLSGGGAGLTALNASQLTSGTVPDAQLAANIARTNQVWLQGGNAGVATGYNIIGTTDNQYCDIRVNNVRAMRYELMTDAGGQFHECSERRRWFAGEFDRVRGGGRDDRRRRWN